MAVDNLADVTARQLAVLTDLQLVGIDIIDAISPLQVLTEIGESAREDGYLITAGLQNVHQAIDTLGDRQMLGNILHHTDIEALQQGHTTGEALLEVDLSAHGTLRDGSHLSPYPIALRQLVDTLRLNQR